MLTYLSSSIWHRRVLAGRSSVYKFVSSRRKPMGISIEKQITRSSKGLADGGKNKYLMEYGTENIF